MKGYCEKDGIRIGFGQVENTILAAHTFAFDKKEAEQYETV
jgi:fumarylacetoacetase